MSQRRLSLSVRSKYVEASDDVIKDAKFFSRSHDALIRVYDKDGNLIETHEHADDLKRRWFFFTADLRS